MSDNDGFTSAAIMYSYSKRLNPKAKIDYWLHDGKQHGLQDHIDKLMTTNEIYDLIILPDSSSNDARYHDMLDTIHLPCLILDHHLTDVKLSDNAIVVNNQLSPNYKNKELTGAGVVYQFCRFLDQKLGNNWADDYIDLAAWGITGDMGSIAEMENRYIIYEGFKNIRNSLLKCILEKVGYSITGKVSPTWDEIKAKINPTSIAFYVVPLINALIRVGTAEEKELLFRAFVNGDALVPCNKRGAKGTLERADVEAVRVCTNAKAHQNKIKEEAVSRLETKIYKYDLLENKILFVRLDENDKFPSELNGLIAMQLSAKFKKPTIVARLNDKGYDSGSARGLNDSDLKDFRQFLLDSQMFEYAQGHANAFGVSILDDNLSDFHKYANEALANIDFGENYYDVNFVREANSEDLYDLVTAIGQAGDLWGQGNPQPFVYITKLDIDVNDIQVIGKNNDTLKIFYNGMTYIKFFAKDRIDEIRQYSGKVRVEIVGKPAINEYMGRTSPQILIENFDITELNNFNDYAF